MPEAGYGYQISTKPVSDSEDAEFQRELEDYISRRIKAKVYRHNSQTIEPGTENITWEGVIYDTAQLKFDSSTFLFNEGSTGDYLFIVNILVSSTGGASDGDVRIMKYDLFTNSNVILAEDRWKLTVGGFGDKTSVNFSIDESMRPGDKVWVEITNYSGGANPNAFITAWDDSDSVFSIRRLL